VVTALAMPSSKLSIKAKVSAITLTSCITPVDQMLQLQWMLWLWQLTSLVPQPLQYSSTSSCIVCTQIEKWANIIIAYTLSFAFISKRLLTLSLRNTQQNINIHHLLLRFGEYQVTWKDGKAKRIEFIAFINMLSLQAHGIYTVNGILWPQYGLFSASLLGLLPLNGNVFLWM